MLELKEGETYHITTLDDLYNCPINMMDECLKAIQECFIAKLNKIEELGKGITMSNSFLSLTNDGIDTTTIEMRSLGDN